MNNIVSFSGGKDSTAMLLMMLERGESVHSVVFFDTGWEFPGMFDHIKQVEDYTGIEIVRLKPRRAFVHCMIKHPVIKRTGPNKGKVHRIGYGWPGVLRRWCTREKIAVLDKNTRSIKNPTVSIGYSKGEEKRCKSKEFLNKKWLVRSPLIEYGITEAQALEYCKLKGFNWGGLYDHFKRVSCFCCPLQPLSELRTLRKHFPELWAGMLKWDLMIKNNRGFHHYDTVHDLEFRFNMEEKGYTLKEIKAMKQGQSFLFDSVPHGLRPRK